MSTHKHLGKLLFMSTQNIYFVKKFEKKKYQYLSVEKGAFSGAGSILYTGKNHLIVYIESVINNGN